MRFFRLPRPNPKFLDEETLLQKLVRVLVILLLFGGVTAAFWYNNERRMERLELRKPQPAHSFQYDGKPASGAPFT